MITYLRLHLGVMPHLVRVVRLGLTSHEKVALGPRKGRVKVRVTRYQPSDADSNMCYLPSY